MSAVDHLTGEQREVLEHVRNAANLLAKELGEAERLEIPQTVLLPELVSIMREAGLLPKGLKIPFFGSGG